MTKSLLVRRATIGVVELILNTFSEGRVPSWDKDASRRPRSVKKKLRGDTEVSTKTTYEEEIIWLFEPAPLYLTRGQFYVHVRRAW